MDGMKTNLVKVKLNPIFDGLSLKDYQRHYKRYYRSVHKL